MPQKKKTFKKKYHFYFEEKDPIYDSLWVNKYICKLMLRGKKFLIQKYANLAFFEIKFSSKQLPGEALIGKILSFRPLFTYVNKRMGRKFNPVPLLVKPKRQKIMGLTDIVKYTKAIEHRDLDQRINLSLSDIFVSPKNFIIKKIAEDIKFLTEARVFFYMRWNYN